MNLETFSGIILIFLHFVSQLFRNHADFQRLHFLDLEKFQKSLFLDNLLSDIILFGLNFFQILPRGLQISEIMPTFRHFLLADFFSTSISPV